MATQGVVTVRSGGKVVMKIVAGCDGYNAQRLAGQLRKSWPVNADKAYEIALRTHFGDADCLVVITDSNVKHGGDEELSSCFRKTFQQPEFNPRWKNGTADYVVIIDV